MHADHLIAQCGWQTTLDQQSRALELQNFISQWSHTVLHQELGQFLNQRCPSNQTWRIHAIQLDLGDIQLEDLAVELPKRLRESLRKSFDHLFANQKIGTGGSNDSHNLQILDHSATMREFVIWFLLNGTVPWWFKGQASALHILDQEFQQHASATSLIIRDLGRSESVRKRLVWQLGEKRVRRIIHLLEPWQGDYICAYADNLFTVQAQRQVPTSNTSDFRHSTWMNILTHLLVERGSLFNTIAFVRANLWQTAQHYQIDYQTLLVQMYAAVQALEPMGLITHTFLTSIQMIYQQDSLMITVPQTDLAPPPDPWTRMQHMLHNGLQRHTVGSSSVQVDTLFITLADQDAERMAQLLRQEGQSFSVRQGIVQHFASSTLSRAVRVLAPQEHLFIVAHVEHMQAQIQRLHGNKQAIWRVLLAYLLGQGSSFNRRQLVQDTIQQVCLESGLEYVQFLDMLLHSVLAEHPAQHRFELISILHMLQTESVQHRPAAIAPTIETKPLLDRLLSDVDMPRTTQTMSERQALGLLKSQVGAAELHSVSDVVLSQRLLKLVDAANLNQLFDALEPDASSFCLALLSRLLLWHKQAGLPSLAKIDLAFELPAMLIQALPCFYQNRSGSRRVFNLADFWRDFSVLLQRQGGVDVVAFHQQLHACLAQEKQAIHPEISANIHPVVFHAGNTDVWLTLLIQLLPTAMDQQHWADSKSLAHRLRPPSALVKYHKLKLTKYQQRLMPYAMIAALESGLPKVIPVADTTQCTALQLFQALRRRLLPHVASSASESAVLADWSLAQLWHQLEQSSGDAIANWLIRQPDKYHLLQILTTQRQIPFVESWLLAQLPAELNPPDATLEYLSALLRQGGYWQGARAVLEQQLNIVFWTVSFDGHVQKRPAGQLLARMIASACLRLHIRLSDYIKNFALQQHLLQQAHWREAYTLLIRQITTAQDQSFPAPVNASVPAQTTVVAERIPPSSHLQSDHSPTDSLQQDYLAEYLSHPRLIEIVRHMLKYGRPPSWLKTMQPLDLTRLLFDLFTIRPEELPALLMDLYQQPAVCYRLQHIVPFAWLMDAMHRSAPQYYADITVVENFHRCLAHITLPGISRQQCSALLFHLVLQHWLSQDWRELTAEQLVSNFLWQLMRHQHVSPATLQQAFAPHKDKISVVLWLALTKLMCDAQAAVVTKITDIEAHIAETIINEKLEDKNSAKQSKKSIKYVEQAPQNQKLIAAIKAVRQQRNIVIPMRVRNAGLVIAQGFIQPLFERLGLVKDGQFVTDSAQRRAVHYLQYLVTGWCETPEHELMLNKLLCGLALDEPVEIGIEITRANLGIDVVDVVVEANLEVDLEVCRSLLSSMIDYWSAIGSCSIDGFRGNWLVRDGSLTDAKDHWDLVVDKRAYDVLLARSPFSYSVIKLPWMEKAIYVTWPT